MTNLIVTHDYNGNLIRQRSDGYVSLTDMAKVEGKLIADYLRLESTKEYIEALSVTMGIPIVSLVITKTGKGGGTYAHPEISMDCAQWVSVQFRIWANRTLVQHVKNSAPEPEPQRRLAPQRDLLDYIEAAKSIGLENDPLLRSIFTQRLAEESGSSKSEPKNAPIVVTVRAQELGIPQSGIGTGTQLGKFIRAKFEPIGQTHHGRYKVYVYAPSDDLDAAIVNFFGAEEF